MILLVESIVELVMIFDLVRVLVELRVRVREGRFVLYIMREVLLGFLVMREEGEKSRKVMMESEREN